MERRDDIHGKSHKRHTWMSVGMDTLFLVLGFVIWGLVYKLGRPVTVGFFCNDQSLMKPYQPSTISTTALLAGVFLIPVFMITVVELITIKAPTWSRKGLSFVQSFYSIVEPLIFGLVCTFTLTEAAKFTTGSLRPSFFEVCQPKWTGGNCTDNTFIYEYECQGHNFTAYQLRHNRMSFWSTHAAAGSYSMVYLVMYLEFRFIWRNLWLLKLLLQFLCIFLAFFAGMTRITDNKHHMCDVLVGFLVGTCISLVIIYNVQPRWEKRRQANSMFLRQVSAGQASVRTTTTVCM